MRQPNYHLFVLIAWRVFRKSILFKVYFIKNSWQILTQPPVYWCNDKPYFLRIGIQPDHGFLFQGSNSSVFEV